MKIIRPAVFASLFAASAALAECPRWISVMPLNGDRHDELAHDCADLGNTTFVDGIAWCCPVNPEGDPVADPAAIYAERYRDVVPKLKAMSKVRQGVLLRTIRENFAPEIPGMICVNASPQHIKYAREFAHILAGPGHRPMIRGAGAPYHGRGLFHIVNARSSYARQLNLVGKDVVYMQECDTCPQTLWATSATRTYDHLVMLAQRPAIFRWKGP